MCEAATFVFVYPHSHVAYDLDYGGALLIPSAVRAMAARCKLPFALRPGLSQEDMIRTKEITPEKRPNKGRRQKKETKESATGPPQSSSADAMKDGVSAWRSRIVNRCFFSTFAHSIFC